MPTDEALSRTGPAAALAQPRRTAQRPALKAGEVPDYLRNTYKWAYLSPRALKIFDHPFVVRLILWGNFDRLKRTACREIDAGSTVLQTACVYGDLSSELADAVGPDGSLEIIDVAPIQVQQCRTKLEGRDNVQIDWANAGDLGERGPYDAICCFFLLHEVPEEMKAAIVAGILDRVRPGGRVVFVDYHRPWLLHPLRPIMYMVFRLLEPFALPLWRREILSYLPDGGEGRDFTVRKTAYFGGLYQKVVVERSP